jgi:hypothetical protein
MHHDGPLESWIALAILNDVAALIAAQEAPVAKRGPTNRRWHNAR